MSEDYRSPADRPRVRPLEDIRVVDLSQALAGPYATTMLADAGADVIKVERPGTGDSSRAWGPPFVQPAEGVRESGYFMTVNRGKRSVELDLQDSASLQILLDAIDEADVVVENFRPGTMVKLGLDPAMLRERNPRLVGVSISGFGGDGPDGQRPGFDQILQGESGVMSVTGPDSGSPTKFGVPIADMLAGIFAAHGVALGLFEREQTGRGTWINTSLLECLISVHAIQGARWLIGGEVPEAEGNKHPTIAPYNAYNCTDGLLNVAIGSESLWATFAPLIGLEVDDTRFASNADRVANSDVLDSYINGRFSEETVDDWYGRLSDAGLPVGRVLSLDAAYSSPQVAHLGIVRTLQHQTVGPIDVPGPPLRFEHGPFGATEAAPSLGQHNDLSFGWRDLGERSHRGRA